MADVSDESMVEATVEAAIGDTGRLDFAVNNAGYDGEFQLTTDYSTEMLDRMIAVSMRGPRASAVAYDEVSADRRRDELAKAGATDIEKVDVKPGELPTPRR